MRLGSEGRAIDMQIIDDGSGIDSSKSIDGMGLRIMQYRARMIGATIEIQSGDTPSRESGGTHA